VLGKKFVPGQCNNSYIFPGVGLGVTFCHATRVTQEHFVMAAHAVADAVTEDRLALGCLFPPLSSIRDVSLEIASRVAQNIIKTNVHRLAVVPEKHQLKGAIASFRYTPAAAKL
jgi:malic enzyme